MTTTRRSAVLHVLFTLYDHWPETMIAVLVVLLALGFLAAVLS